MWCESPMALPCRCCGIHQPVHRRWQGVTKSGDRGTGLERPVTEGKSPVSEIALNLPMAVPSSVGDIWRESARTTS